MRNKAMLAFYFYYVFKIGVFIYFSQNCVFLIVTSLLAQTGFQTTCWDFGHLKTSLLAQTGFQTTFWDFGHLKTSLLAFAGFQTTFWDFGRSLVEKFDFCELDAR